MGRLDLLATLVPSLTLLIVVAAIVVAVAILGRTASDQERAWWASLGGLLTMRAIYWSAGMATIFYLPGVFYAAGGVTRAFIASDGWRWRRWACLRFDMARRGPTPPVAAGSCDGRQSRPCSFSRDLWARSLSSCRYWRTCHPWPLPVATTSSLFAYYLRGIEGTQILTLILVATGSGIVYGLARRLIDVNLFSLGAVESDRLTSCYLAASRPIAAWRQCW